MNVPEWVKPGAWGLAGGAAAAMIVGFTWGGWMTGSTAEKLATDRSETAVVAAFTPMCVAKAKLATPADLALLKAESSWSRDDFIVKSGWVAGVDESHRAAVAEACAPIVVEAMDAPKSS